MSSDDDWFEQAIDDEEDDDGSTDDEPTEAESVEDDVVEDDEGRSGTGSEASIDEWDDWGDDTTEAFAGESEPGSGVDGTGDELEPETGAEADGGDGTGDGDDEDGGLFEEDFASALEGGGSPDAPGGAGAGMDGSGAGGFGMADSGGGFGMDDSGGSGVGGGDPAGGFGMADSAGGGFDAGGDDFGMGNLDPGSRELDEEELESDIDRIELGIEGLDAMVQGGIPKRSLMVAIGSAGTGKTTFGLQFLTQGLRNGERGVFIALEERRESIVESATEKGMPFDEYVAEGDLAIVDIDPVEMANSLKNIQSELPGLVQEFGASRLVLDSVSLLEMMYQDRARRRNEIYDFTRSLKDAGITTLLVSEASDDNPYASRYGIVEYLTDAVFVLQYVRPSDFRETRLAVEIQKIRDANHSRETKPYEITDDGIDVYRQANIF